jgi:flagellar motility protein MotE (MotC chaperone)
MKSMKRAILFILILNLLAMLGGIGWLFSSGRMSKDRVLELTNLFEEPVAIEDARLKSEEQAAAAVEAAKPKPLPDTALNSDERNLVRVEMTQVDMARLERMKREVESLQAILRQERAELSRERKLLEEERTDFEEMRDRLAGLEGGKQFKKALGSLTGMKAKDAKTVLSTMLDEGDKYEEVVSYLSAMDERARTSILTEFVKAGENQLAADLLESVRLRGLETTTADGTTP